MLYRFDIAKFVESVLEELPGVEHVDFELDLEDQAMVSFTVYRSRWEKAKKGDK